MKNKGEFYILNRFLIKKLVTAIIFIVILMFFCIQNIRTSWRPLIETGAENAVEKGNESGEISKYTFMSKLSYLQEKIESIESTINENTYKRYRFIEVYGFLHNVMGKNEEANFEVIKDKDDILHYTYFADGPKDTEEFAVKTEKFKNNIKDKKVKIIYLMTPDKYIKGKTEFEKGLPYNYANETADNYLQNLAERNIDYIDLRENILRRGLEPLDLFYKTDHHWNIQTAFDQYVELVKMLNSLYDMKIDESGYYTNAENYNFITYKNSYIGSMGRKCGKYYDGVDDFTLVYPKFETSFSFYARTKNQEINSQGRFEDALISVYSINKQSDEYALNENKYDSYQLGNHGEVHITNNNNKNGIKALFIKDSFDVPLSTFFSNICSETYLIDPRYYEKDILKFVNSKELDVIFISFSPQNISDEFFNF